MQNVVLKGHKNGYVIAIRADSKFEDVLAEVTTLFADLQKDEKRDSAQPISFNITTGTRLLSAEEKKKIEDVVSNYPLFSIHKFTSDVMLVQDAIEMVESKVVHLNANTVRNGQIEYIKGDVLFIGNLHRGGILRATGNVFLLGNCEGIIHAGYLSDAQAIIAGNVSKAQQVRIADVVDIISDDEEKMARDSEVVVYVNDLHALDYTERDQVKVIRPKLFAHMGGY
ncbi:septum site-determining protein MinC [Liquorilactobacillus mali]|uniref:Probable septum site-determining protein MinC n=1 Tax=Liquorilactobacillus mali KCTC 3596 = DSM 20444 TaxID=1046596 RepID=J0UV25_9LACO|nr:septum site-determining protein MinC [Liquorilactobacillus mali]EJF02162.1 Cell division inhibitor [Liquorilactobacillus mali KCTC 3596 = DSM 20444]KRN10232.1 cell division inhibitor [Liquorilactobacillus mali KCTC 3596 = DSM 20444]MDC7952765.1 cell division inhibitor [Liquorilactobacillus mali]MDV7757945.1 cell division inhibitor [Liquorilactobacillus mali]QFQ74503.1 cell division inhibitor [Liquorilactobacillus mali]